MLPSPYLRAWVFLGASAWLALATSAASDPGRMINLSSRAATGQGGAVMIAGFVIGGEGTKTVLVRGLGPALQKYGVTGTLADPILTLYNADQKVVAANDNWSSVDALQMERAGAFALSAGSKDAVLVATLAPGAYSAILHGAKQGTGVGLIEVYDLGGSARLLNLSTRAQGGTASGVLISGFYLGGAERRTVLIRAMGPTLAQFGVNGVLARPQLTLHDAKAAVVASNQRWGSSQGAAIAEAARLTGAYPFPSDSHDSALLLELPPGPYSVHVNGVGGTSGIVLLEVYDASADKPSAAKSSVSLVASGVGTAPGGAAPATFTFSRIGALDASLTVNYTLSGTAVPGVDYASPGSTVTFAPGQESVTVAITALPSTAMGTRSVTASLAPASAYDVALDRASVTLYYGGGSLYVAKLGPGPGVASSGYGSFSLQLSPDERSAVLSVSLGNLSSPQTVAYLRLSVGGEEGVQLFRVPNGDSTAVTWTVRDSGGYTAAQIVQALKEGQVYLSIETTQFPGGELRGSLVRAAGFRVFEPPAASAYTYSDNPTPAEAARFLMQATFGPRPADIDALGAQGFRAWIDAQMSRPVSSHREATLHDFSVFNTNADATRPGGSFRQAAWWKIAIQGEDQLRQRVAFALSQIFVISDANGTIGSWQEGVAHYYDQLAHHAFGNFRELLEEVTLSPMMGVYLSHVRNGKATATTAPDENYAREVMQLFTIGLQQLQPDGSLKLDGTGRPMPTYDQATITEMARVFTGWQFAVGDPTTRNFRSGGNQIAHFVTPMMLNPNFHDDGQKTIVDGRVLPAGQGGRKDLTDALDALFQHPNTGPFIVRQLIQRLVTSNPSRGYVYRVAQVFADNGKGTRGDMGAVVRAILLDPEARATALATEPGQGKLKEPLLRVTALLRALNGASDNGRFNIANPQQALAQAALRAPSVFNFFEPDYVVPGALAAAGLYAPEYQILTDTTAISIPNNLYTYIQNTRSETTIGLDLSRLPPSSQPETLVEQLDLLFCAGSLAPAAGQRIASLLRAMPTSTTEINKQRSALYLVVSTQAAAVQK